MKKEICGLCLILSSTAFAVEMPLSEALTYAEKWNNSIMEKKLEAQSSDLDLSNSKIKRLPSFDWTSGIEKDESNDSYSHSVSIKQDIYKGNSISNGVKKAKLELQKSNLELMDEIESVKLSVTKYYMNALNYQNQLKIYNASLEELKVQYEKQKMLYENKLISKSDLLELEAEIIEMESKILEMENNYKVEMEKLKLEIQYDDSEKITLVMPDLENLNIDYDLDLNSLEENNMEIKISKIDEEISDKNIEIQEADYLPNLDFTFSYSSSDSELADSLGEWDWKASLNFSYELHDWGETKNEVEILKNSKKIQKINKTELIEQAVLDLLTKFLELEKYSEQIKAQKKLILAREEKFKIDKVKFENHLIDISTFISSKNDMTSSKTALINLETEYYTAYQEYINIKK